MRFLSSMPTSGGQVLNFGYMQKCEKIDNMPPSTERIYKSFQIRISDV